jgi:hypothetical protein
MSCILPQKVLKPEIYMSNKNKKLCTEHYCIKWMGTARGNYTSCVP